MHDHTGRFRSFVEVWPLLALRYGMITAGVLAWLWEAEASIGVAAGAIVLSCMLVFELPVYSSTHTNQRTAWSLVQFAFGTAALAMRPGLASGLILCGVLSGMAANAAWPAAIVCLVAISGLTVFLVHASVTTLVGLISLYVLAVAVGRLFLHRFEEASEHRATIEQLEAAQHRIADFAEATRDLAATHERQRLAEELHDTLGHALVGTLLHIQIARKMLATDTTAAEERLRVVETNVRETLDQVRQALRRGMQRRGDLPLHMALESLVADFRAAGGPQVELAFIPDVESVSDVGREISALFYRTTQEALTNAVRHGGAKHIRVEVEATGRRWYLRITDDGVGADQYSPGMGLSGMVSRVQAVGGTLRFETAPGQGFQIEVGVARQ